MHKRKKRTTFNTAAVTKIHWNKCNKANTLIRNQQQKKCRLVPVDSSIFSRDQGKLHPLQVSEVISLCLTGSLGSSSREQKLNLDLMLQPRLYIHLLCHFPLFPLPRPLLQAQKPVVLQLLFAWVILLISLCSVLLPVFCSPSLFFCTILYAPLSPCQDF